MEGVLTGRIEVRRKRLPTLVAEIGTKGGMFVWRLSGAVTGLFGAYEGMAPTYSEAHREAYARMGEVYSYEADPSDPRWRV